MTTTRSLFVDAALIACTIAAFLGEIFVNGNELSTAAYFFVLIFLFGSGRPYPIAWIGGVLAFAKLFAFVLRPGGAVFEIRLIVETLVGAGAIALCGLILANQVTKRSARTDRPARRENNKDSVVAHDSPSNAIVQDGKFYRSVYSQTHVALWTQDLRQLRAVLAYNEDGVVSDIEKLDLKYISRFINTVEVNHAAVELMGAKDPLELLGPFEKFMPASSIDASLLLRAIKFGERIEGKGRITRCDGQQIEVVFSVVFQNDSEAPDRAMVGMLDVTGKRRHALDVAAAKAELDRLFRAAAIDAVSASIAHEITQPLGAMLMNAQTSLRLLKQPNMPAAVAAIERTISNIEQATEIVQKIRFQTATHFKPLAAADVPAAIQETQRLMRSELDAHSVRVSTTVGDGLPPVALDTTELLQVLVNISRNAIQAMFDTSVDRRLITIDAALIDEENVRISISDAGCGFSSKVQPRMFETFFTTKSNGTGLGLSICKSIVEARGGRLIAHPRSEGGATFSVLLPVLSSEQSLPGSDERA